MRMETDEANNKENQGGVSREGKRFRRVPSSSKKLREPLKEINGAKRKFKLKDEEIEEAVDQEHTDKRHRGDREGHRAYEMIGGEGVTQHWCPKDH